MAQLTADAAGDGMPGEFVIAITAQQFEQGLEWGGLELAVGDRILRVVLPDVLEVYEAAAAVADRGMLTSEWYLQPVGKPLADSS